MRALADELIGLVDLLVDCVIGWLVVRMVGCLIDWLISWLIVFECLIKSMQHK